MIQHLKDYTLAATLYGIDSIRRKEEDKHLALRSLYWMEIKKTISPNVQHKTLFAPFPAKIKDKILSSLRNRGRTAAH